MGRTTHWDRRPHPIQYFFGRVKKCCCNIVLYVNSYQVYSLGSMRPPAAASRGLSPRVTTPALIVWQSTRHLVAESRYPGKISNNKTDVVVDGTPRYQRWTDGMVCLPPSPFLRCRAVVELRYRSRSDTQTLPPHTTMRLSRNRINPAGVLSFLFLITVEKILRNPLLVSAPVWSYSLYVLVGWYG